MTHIVRRHGYLFNIGFIFIMIIFVLLAIIPSVIRLVEAKRFEEDLEQATRLTDLIKDEIDTAYASRFDAYEVKRMIREELGDSYHFDTKSRHTGFFFDAHSNVIRVCRFSELGNNPQAIGLPANTDQRLITPEEPFYDDLFYLGDEESCLSKTINHIRTMDEHMENAIVYHETYRDKLPNPGIPFFHNIYGMGLTNGEHQAIMNLLDRFDPRKVLWVNDSNWNTAAKGPSDIERILFSEGIRNIPAFTWPSDSLGRGIIELDQVYLPRTVTNIETRAFTDESFDIEKLLIHSINGLYTQKGALTGVKQVERDLLFFNEALLDFTPYMTYNYTSQGVEVDFSDNPDMIIDNEITGYQPTFDDHILYVHLYSHDRLVGYATNAYITEYYLDESDLFPYYTHVSHVGEFYEPPIPTGFDTFSGWMLGDDSIPDDQIYTMHKRIIVFAHS